MATRFLPKTQLSFAHPVVEPGTWTTGPRRAPAASQQLKPTRESWGSWGQGPGKELNPGLDPGGEDIDGNSMDWSSSLKAVDLGLLCWK